MANEPVVKCFLVLIFTSTLFTSFSLQIANHAIREYLDELTLHLYLKVIQLYLVPIFDNHKIQANSVDKLTTGKNTLLYV